MNQEDLPISKYCVKNGHVKVKKWVWHIARTKLVHEMRALSAFDHLRNVKGIFKVEAFREATIQLHEST